MAEQSVRDRAVEAVVMHMSDPWSDSPLIRCDCDEPNLTVTGYARHLVDVFAAAGLLAGDGDERFAQQASAALDHEGRGEESIGDRCARMCPDINGEHRCAPGMSWRKPAFAVRP